MKFGVHVFPTEHSIQPGELAKAAEDRGLDSVWFSEHTHIPVSFLQNPVGRPSLPDYYWQTYDLFVAMTAAALATHTIKIASGVSLVIEHHPINLAKGMATIDLISRGRLICGFGAGWLEPEMADHGVAYRTRFKLLKEQVRAIKEIWITDESEFHGRFVNFKRMRSFPKPCQKPHPPIIMGGEGPKALECAAELCDGWAPWGMPWERAKSAIEQLNSKMMENGRTPDQLEISLFEKSLPEMSLIEEMETAGVKRIILSVLGMSRDPALAGMDDLARLVERLR